MDDSLFRLRGALAALGGADAVPRQNRFNCDQIPIPLSPSRDLTLTLPEERKTGVIQKSDPFKKQRFCTAQLCISADPDGPQPPITVCFAGARGKVPCARKAEQKMYDPEVPVQWQRKAWYDSETCVEWASKVFIPYVRSQGLGRPILLYCDQLGGHVYEGFRRACLEEGIYVLYGPGASTTHVWQPIDRGVGRTVKARLAVKCEEWLAGLWRHNSPITPRDKRVLVTNWLGSVWRDFPKSVIEHVTKVTGLSDPFSEKVAIERSKEYAPPPPYAVIPWIPASFVEAMMKDETGKPAEAESDKAETSDSSDTSDTSSTTPSSSVSANASRGELGRGGCICAKSQ